MCLFVDFLDFLRLRLRLRDLMLESHSVSIKNASLADYRIPHKKESINESLPSHLIYLIA